jgi:hypothetical protein
MMRIAYGNWWTPENLFGFAIFFAILCIGLRSILNGFRRDSYWTRAGMLYAIYVLPTVIVLAASGFMIFRGPLPASYTLMLMAPACIASLLVSFWPQRDKSHPHAAVKWHPVAALAVIALLIAGMGKAAAQAFQRAKGEANRAALAAIPPIPQNLPYPKLFFQKGVNFTAEFPGGYPSENARQMLRGLPKHGVNAIALVPYGFSERSSGHVGWGGGLEREDSMEQLSRVAHQLNIKVLLKPQVWVRQGFPGDLEFSSAQIRSQWFAEYLRFVEHYAEIAKRIHADMFCVGVEFQKLAKYDSEWRKIIARARDIYPGPLVYAATQGPEFETIKFWDQLDYIGLNNYYPLPDDLSTDAIVRKVELVQHAFHKPIIFTEAGFSSFESPHREPWAEKPGKVSLAEQARCYEAVLQAFYRKPWFQGVYWWKIGTDGHGGSEDGSLTPWGKPAMDVVTRWYLRGGR